MSWSDRLKIPAWPGLLAAFGLFLLSRPYLGVRHDGRLYVADALAKLDPAGVGKDLMFVHDGQFGFSLYTPMLARLIAALGLSGGNLAIVALTLVLWFAALALMIERLMADRSPALRWAALVFVVVLPPLYGPMDVISFGEPYATPRGLAEAAGLLGMAAYLSGRRVLALAVCCAGMLFHPIMGLCAAAAIGVALCLEDRRWLWAGLAGAGVVVLAALRGLPVAERLIAIMDPAWRAVVEARSPFLFPSDWSVETWGRLAVHACTLAAGAWLLKGATRRLAWGALIAGLAGVAVVALLGDRLSLLLFLQVQTWRALQPVAVLAAASLALLCLELPKRGPSGLLGLAFLGAAWMFRDVGSLGLLLAPIGLLFVITGQRLAFSRPALASGGAVALLALTALAYAVLRGLALERTLSGAPETWPFALGVVWSSDLPGLVIALGVGVWLARGWSAPAPTIRWTLAIAVVALAMLLWDARSDFVRQRDAGRDPGLVAMTTERPGEVLWLAGDIEPWTMIGRPSWSSKVQSAGVVFSRPLALALWDRAERLKAAGLAGEDWMRPLTLEASRPPPPRLARVRTFCAAPDAPAWIVWPRWTSAPLEAELKARDWSPAVPFAVPVSDGWLNARRYAVIPCAGGRSAFGGVLEAAR
ncbi:hypothetical protein [Caulobacter sp.]|uniref:hypothetical protein n=1 Tax=Caulobacter sp. TaxID=78 RepID=UPI002B486751|nr:hypothetical protein [Caulobacter sp.]HJV41927.1 hypothetical protein [Caulobacter sp.]